MRILFAIPHYFAPAADANYGSERTLAQARAQVVRHCLASLWQNFSEAQSLLDGRRRSFHPANPSLSADITIALCTTGDRHLVPHLAGCRFEHVQTIAEPRHLGFECHKALRAGIGRYDYFGYLEDDLRITDALFFKKLAWFTAQFGNAAMLQPNRFELVEEPIPFKLYIDGNMHAGVATPIQEGTHEHRRVELPAFGERFGFQRIYNPHSGCFFLNAAQMERWAAQRDFAVPSAAFGGPLESAATLGVMRYYRVYKPSRENAAFLEIEHLDRRYLGRHFNPVAGNPPSLTWQ